MAGNVSAQMEAHGLMMHENSCEKWKVIQDKKIKDASFQLVKPSQLQQNASRK